ncbi:glycosyltransferase [Geomonas sp. RF6]|nr:glycosyltransferase [Geomonas sp. RF6]UFS72800.1 glycosyltransferase [Geomonas sp. RF6]
MGKEAQILVFSSNSALDDFNRFYPGSPALTRVLPFYALPQEKWYSTEFLAVQERYGLPDRFLICSNQFWAHKNHPVLFEAIAKLHRTGHDMHLACTGYTVDYRAPGYFEALQDQLRQLGIEHLVHILGNIPRQDQIQLVRRALAVVQPSLFEGWSTVVEDCRVLGKTMILSDLPVHQEQAPRHGVYFERHSSDSLAATVRNLLPRLAPGPDRVREREAAEEAKDLVVAYGRRFCAIVRDAQALERGEKLAPAEPSREVTPAAASLLPTIRVKTAAPRISLVTPSYNYGEYLEACLDSILSQNYPNLEYIVMDGGSTDNTVQILKKYERHFTYWQSRPDGGQYRAIDDGLRRTTGEIMTWLNADDMFHPGAFETAAEIFGADAAVEWIMGRPNSFDQAGRQKGVLPYLPLNSRARYLADEDFIQQEGIFWKRSLWERAGAHIRTDMKLAADLELWARFFRHAPLYAVDTLLAGFRDHPLQKSKDKAGYTAEANIVLAREREIFAAERPQYNPLPPLPILVSQKVAA